MNSVKISSIASITAGLVSLQLTPLASADQQILDDLIVDGSICAGLDCVNGESFGFDTLRLKENNLRIRAVDTSTSASFPSRDWQITFNESSNGGQNKFSIDDIDGGRTPFTIEAGAPSHSLYVDDGGRIGFGTSTPVADIHVKSGNTPTLRLEQDGSSGFSAQTWDVAGNEANFFVRDASNGSTLPFRIFPGAPSNALNIEASGDIGVGTTSPTTSLHVVRTAAAAANLLRLENNGATRLQLKNTATGDTWTWNASETGSVRIAHSGTGAVDGTELEIFKNGDATLAGTLTELSDQNAKTDIVPLDSTKILAKVMELPVSEWSYKKNPKNRHIGPMAQDFYESFGLGHTEKGIASLDTGGVALAAIQGVKKEQDLSFQRLEAENRTLTVEINELKALIQQLIEADR